MCQNKQDYCTYIHEEFLTRLFFLEKGRNKTFSAPIIEVVIRLDFHKMYKTLMMPKFNVYM